MDSYFTQSFVTHSIAFEMGFITYVPDEQTESLSSWGVFTVSPRASGLSQLSSESACDFSYMTLL